MSWAVQIGEVKEKAMPVYEDETLHGVIKKAVRGKWGTSKIGKQPIGKPRYGKPKTSLQSRRDLDFSQIYNRQGPDTAYDLEVRRRANRLGGLSVHDESAWEIVPGGTSGASIETGRFIRLSLTQISDPISGVSRNIFGILNALRASGGRASVSVIARAVRGPTRVIRVDEGTPVLSNRYVKLDLGSNPVGRDLYFVSLMIGGANFATVRYRLNSLVLLYRERNYEQIGIARHVERVNFPTKPW